MLSLVFMGGSWLSARMTDGNVWSHPLLCVHSLALSYKETPHHHSCISSIFSELWFINNSSAYPYVLGLVSGNPLCCPVLVWAQTGCLCPCAGPGSLSPVWELTCSVCSWWFFVVRLLKVPQVDDEGCHLCLQRTGAGSCRSVESPYKDLLNKCFLQHSSKENSV